MTCTRHLVHGVFWDGAPPESAHHDGGRPALLLQQTSGGLIQLDLDAGTRLGFRLAAEGKYCLGHHQVYSPTERDHVLCPAQSQAVKGSQCERCFAVDDSRLIHDFHRGGRVPAGLRSYLMQPHWLYVATFANGASKVGTASQLRKWNRLAEQGALVASYVAAAQDGRVVRVLEDMVTRETGLAQQIRSATKSAALTKPLPAAELAERNRLCAAGVRAVLAETAVGGFKTVDEQWVRPAQSAALCVPEARHAYPHGLTFGAHGFTIASLCGSDALAALAGSGLGFVVNLGLLRARLIELGDYSSEVPAVQESLF